jgi:AbrB family looped-hinge helix DNA binding protein
VGNRLTSKGQVTIPKAVRDALDLRPGDEVDFVRDNGSVTLRKAVEQDPFDKWRGYLKHLGRSTDELMRVIRDE